MTDDTVRRRQVAWEEVGQARRRLNQCGFNDGSESDFGSPDPRFLGSTAHTEPVAEEGMMYGVMGVPPPLSGIGAAKTPDEIQEIGVVDARKAPDATGNEVTWYELNISAAQHQWSVWKRFSDFDILNRQLMRIGIAKKVSGLSPANSARGGNRDSSPVQAVQYPKLPPKVLWGNVDDRKTNLDKFVKQLVAFMRDMHTTSLPDSARWTLVQAAFGIFVEFWRSSSQSIGHQGSVFGSRRSLPALDDASPSTPSGMTPPSTRILLLPNERFIVIMFVPGVQLSEMFVDMHQTERHSVVIGGMWNSGVEALSEIAPCPREGSSDRPLSILMDCLPTGEFEVVVQIPSPFNREAWTYDMRDGVAFFVWDQKDAEAARQ